MTDQNDGQNGVNGTDEQVLADPDAYTVDQVTEVFARSADDAVAAAKTKEADGRNRSGIAQWQKPAARASSDEPAFTRDRLLGSEGPQITGHSVAEIAGALHDQDGEDFTRGEVDELVAAFHGHTDQTGEEE